MEHEDFFYQFTIAKVAYVLSTAYPQDEVVNGEYIERQKKWIEDDYVCRFTILNAMTNSLFNVFHKFATSWELWNAIQQRYMNEDARNKSLLINKYIEFNFDDSKSKSIIDQVNILNDIAIECADVGEPFSDSFQVSTIIGKLPPSWKDVTPRKAARIGKTKFPFLGP